MSADIRFYGIRHHGPGCARSLLQALVAQPPDCLVIEAPAGCEALLTHFSATDLVPPVALLSHSVDDPTLAVFHPYAEFSPEWQALRWASEANVPVRFMDVPAGVSLAWQRQANLPAAGAVDAPAITVAHEAAIEIDNQPNSTPVDAPETPSDPLDWLAHAAGFGDGESWWNHLVEERSDAEGLFEAIAHAMTELRENAPLSARADTQHEAIREAHMRCVLREVRQQDFQRIAVVCGAWHVPALAGKNAAAADQRLLKGIEKLKSQSTWVPWTYRHLSMRSGYGAGVASPGWYEHLWQHQRAETRTIAWFARIARLLREHEVDCSSAHVIEAARLTDTLAALRERPLPSLDEINEATRSVICNGDDTPMRLIASQLMLGDAIGQVPSSVPTVPLQRDLDAQQKRLRLKPEALSRSLDLDLRNANDLQRSHLLHRLSLLGIDWGQLAKIGRSSRGSFHEIWDLAWEPRFEIDLIVASRHGHTLELAATASADEQAVQAIRLSDLAALVDRVLLANLADAVSRVAAELEARAATDANPLALLGALPALANVYRYGNVRNTDVAQVAHLFDSMLLRGCLGLPLALCDLSDDAAEEARTTLLASDKAVVLRQGEAQTLAWQTALSITSTTESGSPLLRGVCTRLLLDAGVLPMEQVRQLLGLSLSAGGEPLHSAQWLDGFLNRDATVLLHGDVVWALIDEWLCALSHEQFVRVVALVRRAFAQFEATDRRDLGLRVKQAVGAVPVSAAPMQWDTTRAMRALPMLREWLGIADV